MFKKVTITNYRGESVEYLIEGVNVADNNGLLITDIDGLGPVKANINMTKLATADGGIYNSARLGTRNIVIKAKFTNATSIEDARLSSYKFFPIKKKVTFKIETDNRTAITEGYVESNTPNPFSEESDVQISIVCESAFFYGPSEDVTTFAGVDPLFEFPFENGAGYESKPVSLLYKVITKDFLNSFPDKLQSHVVSLDYSDDQQNHIQRRYDYEYWIPVKYDGDYYDNALTIWNSTSPFRYLLAAIYNNVTDCVEFYTMPYSPDGRSAYNWMAPMAQEVVEKFINGTYDDHQEPYYTWAHDYRNLAGLDPFIGANPIRYTDGGDFGGKLNIAVAHFMYDKDVVIKDIEFGAVVLKKFANVHYSGDSQVGCTIELHTIGNVTKDVTIYNLYTRERMVLNMERLSAIIGDTLILGDTITICTVEGKKSITFTRNAETTNILNALDKDVDWLTISKGDNVIGFIADEDEQAHIKLKVTSQVAYEGV